VVSEELEAYGHLLWYFIVLSQSLTAPFPFHFYFMDLSVYIFLTFTFHVPQKKRIGTTWGRVKKKKRQYL